VVVSTGVPQVQVPTVVGLFADTARTRLTNEGLTVDVTFQQVPAGSADVGRVISQSPAAFVLVNTGELITLVVGEAAPVPTTTATTTTTAGPTTTTVAPTTTPAPPTTAAP